jgi:hypothetical protein
MSNGEKYRAPDVIEKAAEEMGQKARAKGIHWKENPFRYATIRWRAWDRAWHGASRFCPVCKGTNTYVSKHFDGPMPCLDCTANFDGGGGQAKPRSEAERR